MERNAEAGQSKLLVQSQFPEAEKIFVDILGEISRDKLLAAIVESAGTVPAIVERRSKEIREMGLQALMDNAELRPQTLDVVFDVRFKGLDISSDSIESVENDLLLSVRWLELHRRLRAFALNHPNLWGLHVRLQRLADLFEELRRNVSECIKR